MKGVPLDARDEMGNTSLIIACQNGQGRCVKPSCEAAPIQTSKTSEETPRFTLASTFASTPSPIFSSVTARRPTFKTKKVRRVTNSSGDRRRFHFPDSCDR